MSNLSHEFQKRQREERQRQIDEAKRAKTQQKKATTGGLVIGVVATIGAVALAAPLLYSAMASDTQVDESMPVASVVQDDNSELEISESSLDDWDTLHADSVETGGGDTTGTDPADPLGSESANPAGDPVDSTGSTEPDILADQNSDREEDIGNSVWEGTGDGYDENELSDDAISDDPADSAAQGDGAQGTDSLAQKAVDAAYRIVRETYGGEDWVPAQSMVATVRLRDDLDSIQVHYDPDVTHYAVILLRVQDSRYTYYECVINPVTEENVLEIGVRIWNRNPETGALVYDSANSHSLSTLYEKEALSPASMDEVQVEVNPSDPQRVSPLSHDSDVSEGAAGAGGDELTEQSTSYDKEDKYTITNLQQALMFGFVNKTENVTTTLQSGNLCWSDSAYGEWQDLSVTPSQTTMSAELYSPPVQTEVKPGTPRIWYFVTDESRTTQISFDDTENSISGISYEAESSNPNIITCTPSASGITFNPRTAGNTNVQIHIYNKLNNKLIGSHNFSVRVFNSWGECVAQAKKDGTLQDKGSPTTSANQDIRLTATADSTNPVTTKSYAPVVKGSPVISASNQTVKFGSSVSLGAKSSSGGTLSYSSSNPGVVKVSPKGVLTPVKLGSAKVTVKTAETSTFVAGSKTVTVTVIKGSPVISASNKTVRLGSSASLGAKSSSGGALSYSSSNSGVVKVSSKGVLTPVKAGSAKVTVKTKETSTFAAGSKAVTVTVAKKSQPMTVVPVKRTASFKTLKSKAVTVAGITVKKNQGSVTYAKTSGTANITINKTTGKLTIKKGTKKGTYKITVKATAKGNNTYATGNKKATATITVK